MEEIQIDKNLKNFQYSLTPLKKEMRKTLSIALMCLKLLECGRMSELEKERFEYHLDRLIQINEGALKIVKKIKGKIK
ncbi:unnamed protein product [marine sediment metagenome]|uniref:Uncharacterized protein n=1 Tax=marine sediment metagenome TaxID=412755 RepID=X1C7W7_9ZZZZ